MNRKAVVLLSGGLDSATAMGIAISHGCDVHPINVQYGQRHFREWTSALALANHYKVDLHVIRVEFSRPIQGSALTDSRIDVPGGRSMSEMTKDIPVTYVPARNLFMLGLAASYAEQIGADHAYVGFNAVDYSGYPDCRPEFVDAMNMAMTAGMKAPSKVYAPVIAMTKAEIIQTALALGVPIKHTWSCYNPIAHKGLGERPCGGCDSCIIRSSAFATLGINDPALEVSQ